MAHNFELPISFTFLSQRVKWKAYAFELAGKRSDFNQRKPTFAGTSIPIPLPQISLGRVGDEVDPWLIRLNRHSPLFPTAGKHEPLFNVTFPELVACLDVIAELSAAGKPIPEAFSELIVTFDPEPKSTKPCDPWQMRDEFLRLEETNADLLRFLNRWGIWDWTGMMHHSRSLALVGQEMDMSTPFCILPFLVWRQRKAIRAAMLGSAEEWLTSKSRIRSLHQRSAFPYIGITDKLAFRAIETTITLDHLRDVKYRICARTDCGNVFKVESEHGKIFCEQYCGHLVSVRRKRAAAKKAKSSKKGKEA